MEDNIKTTKVCILTCVMILPVLILTGCVDKKGDNINIEEEGEFTYLRIGTISDDVDKMFRRYQPTANYIADELSTEEKKYKGKVVLGRDQAEMVQLLKNGEIDLYFDSPMVGYLVAEQTGSNALLRCWKQEVSEYHTVFIVNINSTIGSIQDLNGKRIGFESPDSTSGYLLPKSFMISNGLKLTKQNHPDKVQYLFTDEGMNSALWVADGKVDCAAISNKNLEKIPQAITQELRVINRTEDIPRHIVFTSSEMDSENVQKIKNILIDMDKNPKGKAVLKDFKETKKYDDIPDEERLHEDMMQKLSTLEIVP